MSDQNSTDKIIITSLFDYKVREILLPTLEEYMFSEQIYKGIFKYFKLLNSDVIDDFNTFILKLQDHVKLTAPNLEFLESFYLMNNDYKTTDLKESLNELEKLIVNKKLAYAITNNLKKNGELVVDDSFRASISNAAEFKLESEKVIWNFSSESELEEFKLDNFTIDVIKSKYTLVNANTNNEGYCKGDLICFAAKSGLGKTSCLVDETVNFLNQNKKVLYVNLGDMKPRSMLLRILSNLTTIDQKTLRASGWYDAYLENKDILKNLRSLVLDAGEYDIRTLISKIKHIKKTFDFDVVIVDYDQNVLNTTGASLYDHYGDVYIKLKSLATSENCLVLTASQIKIDYYDEELVPKEALADSSKKQNNLDLLITIGQNNKNPNIGMMHLAKVRDGKSSIYSYVEFKNDIQHLRLLGKDEYNILKTKDIEKEIETYFIEK